MKKNYWCEYVAYKVTNLDNNFFAIHKLLITEISTQFTGFIDNKFGFNEQNICFDLIIWQNKDLGMIAFREFHSLSNTKNFLDKVEKVLYRECFYLAK